MDGCLKGLIATVPRVNPLWTRIPMPIVPCSNRSWLPTIKMFLPHTWVDTNLITTKAAKGDHAGVPTHLWDLECMLVLPHVSPALATLRKLLIWVTSTALWSELHDYLHETHGANWRNTLHSSKTKAKRGHNPVSGKPVSGKRTRGDKNKNNKNNEEKEQNQQTDDSTRSPHNDLVRDISAGVGAIGRFSDSTSWWEWKRASALFFWRWPAGEQRTSARNGMPICIRSRLPKYHQGSRSPDPLVMPLIKEKLQKILD
jgi:hypothetical protein